jgi:uncharacterized protein
VNDRSRSVTTEAVSIPGRDGALMCGVVSRPSSPAQETQAIVFCRSGFQSKSGTGDLHKIMADALAAVGFHVLRFDQPGTGDSPGELARELTLDEYFAEVRAGAFQQDTEDALAWMHQAYAPTAVYLVGVSSGCLSAMLAATAQPRGIAGLILMMPPVLTRAARTAPAAAATAARGYRRRLLDPRAYWNLLTGASDYSTIAATAAAPFAWLAARIRHLRDTLRRSGRPTHPGFSIHFWRTFQALMSRQIRLLFVLAEFDDEAQTFVAEFATPVLGRRHDYARLCTVRTLAETDHDMLSEQGRRGALDAMTAWLTETRAARLER